MNIQSSSKVSTPPQTTPIDSKHERLLRRVLRADAGFSGISGLVCLVGASALTTFTGIPNSTVFQVLGVVLILLSVDFFWISYREQINPWFGITAVLLNIAWIIGSGVLLFGNFLPLTTAGKWSILLIAEIASIFALVQGYAVWKIRQQ